MHTYTLCEVAYLNKAASDLDTTSGLLRNLGYSDEVSCLIGDSISLREQNVIMLYQCFGDTYEDAIHQLLEALLQDALLTESSNRRYTLGQMAWVGMCGFSSVEVKRTLTELGHNLDASAFIANAYRQSDLNVPDWWVRAHKYYPDAAQALLDLVMASYPPGWPHHPQVLDNVT